MADNKEMEKDRCWIEPPGEFYKELLAAYKMAPDYKSVYENYSRTFSLFLFQSTADVKLKFAGNFPRTSYLLKENDATPHQTKIINDARVRIRNIASISDGEKQLHAASDLKALATFVSLVTNSEIPQQIIQCFKDEEIQEKTYFRRHDVIRMIVDDWNDVEIIGHSDEKGAPLIRALYQGSSHDNTYVKELLSKGMRINLLSPVEKNGAYIPEHIICEPDLLVDVTAIAGCFQDYSITPLTNIINKFRKVEETPKMVLGNLAGQMLDEEINLPVKENTLNRSLRMFYENSPLSMLTSGISSDRKKLHDDAYAQKQNIRHAIRDILPSSVGKFNSSEIILEPSFVSEILGIQGRIDFMQLDKKVLIEQKSGKCGYPQHDRNIPVSRENHYVQVLLYMMVLRYNFSEEYIRNHGTQAFLLYSLYPQSLVAIDFAPRLIHKAIEIRNQIAAADYNSSSDGFSILKTLKPDDLLQNAAKTDYFLQYIEPGIRSVLDPIQNADELTQSYFHRFVRFVSSENIFSRLGSRTKANTGFASAWNDSLDDKLQAGNIYYSLTIANLPLSEEGRIESIELNISHATDNDMSNFRIGDAVMLYPYTPGVEPDVRKSIIFRCSITNITVDSLYLKLRFPQSDPHVFTYHKDCEWAVEHDFIESSYSTLYRGLHSLFSVPSERRDLILMQRDPIIDDTRKLKGSYGTFNSLMLSVKQAKDIYLILGPPGSGKTSFGMLNTLKEELLEPESSVLLLSYTNRAVDEICSKLVESDIDFIRIGSGSSSSEYKKYLITECVKQFDKMKDFEDHLKKTRVYVSTTTSINGNTSLFKIKKFSLAIIDEASQILEPHLMPILCATTSNGLAIQKFVMIGDHKQLPAVVQQGSDESYVTEPLLRDIGLTNCRNSLFQRFYEKYGNDNSIAQMLCHQGRMHHDIAVFPNHNFYSDHLSEVPLPHQQLKLSDTSSYTSSIEKLVASFRTAFIAVDSPKNPYSHKVNQNEADVIAALCYGIFQKEKNCFNPNSTLGVIVPYRNQISTIRNTIARNYDAKILQEITIDTVERYQGSQRRYIIYGFTISRPYQLNFLTSTNFRDSEGNEIDRKLNVAMTRAMEHLFIVGNPDILVKNPVYEKLISYYKHISCFIKTSVQDFVEGHFSL